MVKYMLDSTNAGNIPADWTGRVAGYLAGALVPTTIPALQSRFPNKRPVIIAVHSGQIADVADCEKGDFQPPQIPAWCSQMRSVGRDPSVYATPKLWAQIKVSCLAAGVELPWWWEANWDGVAVLSSDPKAVAKQYTNGVVPHDASYRTPGCDTSVTLDYWPGVDQKEEDMATDIYLVTDGPSKGYQLHNYGYGPVHINGPQSQELFNSGPVNVIKIGDVTYQGQFVAFAKAAALQAASQTQIDVKDLATQLAAQLGPTFSQELVTALGQALSNG